jgi:4-amino-4-deoxy-L-arabinose transferase-like glycosyltransferase
MKTVQEESLPPILRISFPHFLSRESVVLLLLLLLAGFVLLFGLGKNSLRDYDEGIYAQVAREMVENKEWITLHFSGEPWFEKPPLSIWATAVLYKYFGINEFSARATSATAGCLVLLLTYSLGQFLFDRRVGFIAALLLLTSYEFIRQSRNGTMDMILTLFVYIIIYAYYRLRVGKQGWWYIIWGAFALGFLVKSWAVLIVLPVVVVSLFLDNNTINHLQSKQFWKGFILAVALILPWHLIMYIYHGDDFINRYLFYDFLVRSSTSLEGNVGGPRYYFDRLQHDFSPWFLLIPIGIVTSITEIFSSQFRTRILLIFVVIIFGFYSLFVQTKIFHYLTPIYPALAILIAGSLVMGFDDYRSTAFGGLIFAGLLATLIPSKRVFIPFYVLIFLLSAAHLLVRFLARGKTAMSEMRRSGEAQQKDSPFTNRLINKLLSLSNYCLLPTKNFFRLVVVILFLFLSSIGILRSRHLFQGVVSPVENISRIASSFYPLNEEPIIGLALPPNYEDAIVGPSAMFYSSRPILVAWSLDELSDFVDQGLQEIILGERFIKSLSEEYELTILAQSEPFVYANINRRRLLE